jgi:hypothetical protein
MTVEEAFGEKALKYRQKYGRPMDVGLRSDNVYRAWRRLGMPSVSGGGSEPVYFTTLTFAGPTKVFEDQACAEDEFSILVPDE